MWAIEMLEKGCAVARSSWNQTGGLEMLIASNTKERFISWRQRAWGVQRRKIKSFKFDANDIFADDWKIVKDLDIK